MSGKKSEVLTKDSVKKKPTRRIGTKIVSIDKTTTKHCQSGCGCPAMFEDVNRRRPDGCL